MEDLDHVGHQDGAPAVGAVRSVGGQGEFGDGLLESDLALGGRQFGDLGDLVPPQVGGIQDVAAGSVGDRRVDRDGHPDGLGARQEPRRGAHGAFVIEGE